MMKLNREELKNKVYACWLGKNIGGTIGTPYECSQKINDCTGFNSEPGVPLANDDLDLQLVWLKAMEELGPKNVDCKSLGEYWLEYITPYWNEYGIAKANMKRGIVPPISGQYNNYWKHSNGAWIRTEIWASLYPGDVENAIYYACEDACVDHGNAEGTYAAIFIAAIESAAFLFNDLRALIEMGLSKIPEKCRVYQYVTKVLECFDGGMTWQETRNLLVDMSLKDEELGWFQAPANIGYTVIGLLYGNKDFKETVLICCNCGDDTDCSCATAGALLGIMYGMSIIPEDWKAYIGDSIITVALNGGAILPPKLCPKSCTELTDRVMNLQSVTLYDSEIEITDGETQLGKLELKDFCGREFSAELGKLSDYHAVYKSVLADALVEYDRAPDIEPNGTFKVKISLKPNLVSQKVFNIKWYLPEGFTVEGKNNICAFWQDYRSNAEYLITAPEKVSDKNIMIAVVTCEGHFDTLSIPVVLLG